MTSSGNTLVVFGASGKPNNYILSDELVNEWTKNMNIFKVYPEDWVVHYGKKGE